ncbi:hypothetical protein VKT23_013577 [Stygiomarasmius scandens]|uniref:Methyltransferase domain-containing protein n=1 Tax=Marasmiellus scandens TaxID=2682957 RepID=A0ABR1J5H1_9AGAR
MQAENSLRKDDPKFELELDPDEAQFFQSQTGITNLEELRSHILSVQEEALKIHAYPCIRTFLFLRLRIAKHPAYKLLLEGIENDKTALFLDVGCCFGVDIRNAIADGCPGENIVGSDINQEFWDLGHKLFWSNPDTITSTFIAGNILDPSFILQDPSEKQNLAAFKGKFKFIHASNFFHLFSEEDQKKAAEHLAVLLSPTPGSVIFGSHGGRLTKGLRTEAPPPSARGMIGNEMFCHSPSSWTDMWKAVIPGDKIRIDVELVQQSKENNGFVVDANKVFYRLEWSVTRM